MSSERNVETIRNVYEAVAAGDLQALSDAMSDDLVEHEDFPGLEPNKEGVLRFFEYLRTAFPDLRMRAHEIVADGDLVAVRGTMEGTHRGEFMEMPPTGHRVAVPFADFFRFEGGLVAEHWGVTDTGVMMDQLGMMEG